MPTGTVTPEFLGESTTPEKEPTERLTRALVELRRELVEKGAVSYGDPADEMLCEHGDAMVEAVREDFQDTYGYDPAKLLENFAKSARAKMDNVYGWIREGNGQGRRLSEAVTQDQLGALLRFGVVKQTIDFYKLPPAIYRSLAQMEESNSYEEQYDPVQNVEQPVEVGENEAPPQTKITGRAVVIRNRRFARLASISKALFMNDKTGQVKRKTQAIANGMVIAEDILWVTMVALTYAGAANLIANGGLVPGTNVAGVATLDGQATTAGAPNQQRIEDAYTAAAYITDDNGNIFVVDFDSILCTKRDEITLLKLLQSMLNPTTPAGTPGAVQGVYAKNVMEGKLAIYPDRYLSRARAGLVAGAPPWIAMEKKKGFVFQSRTNMAMMMEPPNVGQSLREGTYNYVVERWMSAGCIEARFAYWGN